MTVFAQTTGDGPDVVLLHGWGMNADVWEDVIADLSPSFRVTAIDLPGHGRSHDAGHDYSLNELANQVMKVTPPGSVLVGWSLGGLAAMQLALEYPGHINKLVLVASSPQFIKSDDWPDGMDPDVLDGFAGDLQGDYEHTLKRFIAIQTMGSDNAREEQRILRDRVFRHGHPVLAALDGGLKILQRANLRPRLAEIACPVLLLSGEKDTLFCEKAANTTLHLLKNGKLSVIKGAGHAPFLSHRPEFLQELRTFQNG